MWGPSQSTVRPHAEKVNGAKGENMVDKKEKEKGHHSAIFVKQYQQWSVLFPQLCVRIIEHAKTAKAQLCTN